MMKREDLHREIKSRYDGMAEAMAGAAGRLRNGGRLTADNMGITIDNGTMADALYVADPKGTEPRWAHLQALLNEVGGARAREYPGAHLVPLIEALAPAAYPGKSAKEA